MKRRHQRLIGINANLIFPYITDVKQDQLYNELENLFLQFAIFLDMIIRDTNSVSHFILFWNFDNNFYFLVDKFNDNATGPQLPYKAKQNYKAQIYAHELQSVTFDWSVLRICLVCSI